MSNINREKLVKSMVEIAESDGVKLSVKEMAIVEKAFEKAFINGVSQLEVEVQNNGKQKSEKLSLAGFITATAKFVEAGEARNPKTNTIVPTEAKTVPKIKIGKDFKDTVIEANK